MANRVLVSMQEGMNEPVWFSRIEEFVKKILQKAGYDGEELSILFCDDVFIHNLNKEYRNIDASTDVLSFEAGEEYEDDEGQWYSAGDIVISLDTLPKNAEYFEVDKNTEFKRLLIHGVLHLNGMDHGEEHIEKDVEPSCEMLVLQEKILEELADEIIWTE